MLPSRRLLAVLVLGITAAACSGSTTSPSAATSAAPAQSASVAPPSTAASMAPSTSAEASSAPASAAPSSPEPSLATAAPTVLDPAQLVTQSEASSLAGVTLGACVASDVNNRKTCTYSATGIQVEIAVIQAPSQAALDAGKAAVLADLQKAAANGLKTTRITGIGDDAALLTGSHTTGGIALKGVGVYAVKGLTFVAITVIGIGHAVPSAAAVEAQATTTVGRIP